MEKPPLDSTNGPTKVVSRNANRHKRINDDSHREENKNRSATRRNGLERNDNDDSTKASDTNVYDPERTPAPILRESGQQRGRGRRNEMSEAHDKGHAIQREKDREDEEQRMRTAIPPPTVQGLYTERLTTSYRRKQTKTSPNEGPEHFAATGGQNRVSSKDEIDEGRKTNTEGSGTRSGRRVD